MESATTNPTSAPCVKTDSLAGLPLSAVVDDEQRQKDALHEIQLARTRIEQAQREDERRELAKIRKDRMADLEGVNGADLVGETPVERLSESQFGELMLAASRRNRQSKPSVLSPPISDDRRILTAFASALGNLEIPELTDKGIQRGLDEAADEFFFAVQTLIAKLS